MPSPSPGRACAGASPSDRFLLFLSSKTIKAHPNLKNIKTNATSICNKIWYDTISCYSANLCVLLMLLVKQQCQRIVVRCSMYVLDVDTIRCKYLHGFVSKSKNKQWKLRLKTLHSDGLPRSMARKHCILQGFMKIFKKH